MRPIDADALIDKCGGWYVEEGTESGFIGTLKNLLATMPTIQPVATDTNVGDAISRQAAIEKFAMTAPQMSVIRIYEAVEILESMPTIQPEPQWIPVSERLPETEEFVLASLTGKYRNTTFEHACEIADYADGGWCVYAYPHMSAEKCEELIEAWMPLPEAYKPNK